MDELIGRLKKRVLEEWIESVVNSDLFDTLTSVCTQCCMQGCGGILACPPPTL